MQAIVSVTFTKLDANGKAADINSKDFTRLTNTLRKSDFEWSTSIMRDKRYYTACVYIEPPCGKDFHNTDKVKDIIKSGTDMSTLDGFTLDVDSIEPDDEY